MSASDPAGSARISPTAYYTGHVWLRHGLSDPALRTREGELMFAALRPLNAASRLLGGPTLEDTLLARHMVIDHLLERAIAGGQVTQVLEVAAGLSPRGLRFSRRHPGLRYVEADLPGMAARKRAALRHIGSRAGHEVVDLDALAAKGPRALAAVAAAALDPSQGLAIITEGLVNYFDGSAVLGMWRRFAALLAAGPYGLYLSDLHLAEDVVRVAGGRAFSRLLSWFARGSVHYPFADPDQARAALTEAGFARVQVELAGDYASELAVADPRRSAGVRVVRAELGRLSSASA